MDRNILTFLIVIIFCCLIAESYAGLQSYKMPVSMMDVTFSGPYLFAEVNLESYTDCALLCFWENSCLSFTFAAMTGECRGYDRIFTTKNTAQCFSNPGTLYFHVEQDWKGEPATSTAISIATETTDVESTTYDQYTTTEEATGNVSSSQSQWVTDSTVSQTT